MKSAAMPGVRATISRARSSPAVQVAVDGELDVELLEELGERGVALGLVERRIMDRGDERPTLRHRLARLERNLEAAHLTQIDLLVGRVEVERARARPQARARDDDVTEVHGVVLQGHE